MPVLVAFVTTGASLLQLYADRKPVFLRLLRKRNRLWESDNEITYARATWGDTSQRFLIKQKEQAVRAVCANFLRTGRAGYAVCAMELRRDQR